MYRPDVVAGKYDEKLFDPSGQTLLVNEMFYSVQGEGRYAGHAALFIRMAKCNLACKFCDTEFEKYDVLSVATICTRAQELTLEDRGIAAGVAVPLVILTGGEPGLQNCRPLLRSLQGMGAVVHIETSGSVWSEWMRDLDFITVSPKVQKDRLAPELVRELTRSDYTHRDRRGQVKWIVNAAFMMQYARNPDDVYLRGVANCLQPESQKPEWTSAAIELVKRWPMRYTLSMQMHKYAGER